jgi:hypothetical protein
MFALRRVCLSSSSSLPSRVSVVRSLWRAQNAKVMTVHVGSAQFADKAHKGPPGGGKDVKKGGHSGKDSNGSGSGSGTVAVKKTPVGKVVDLVPAASKKLAKAEPPSAKSVLAGLINEEIDDLGGVEQQNDADIEQLLNMSDFSFAVDSSGVARLKRTDATEKLQLVITFDTDYARSQARNVLDDDANSDLEGRRFGQEDHDDDDGVDEDHDDDVGDFDRRGGSVRPGQDVVRSARKSEPDVVRRSTAADDADDGFDDDEHDADPNDVYVYDRVIGVHIVKPGHSELVLSCVAASDGSLIVRTIAGAELKQSEATELAPADFISDSRGMPFLEMAPELQSALRDWFASIGVDDSVATFMQEFIETRKCREQAQTLAILKGLIVGNAKK